ncbi:helix-turn-helix domain-containing protein [Larkinella soli]|uniref:helix-turn-helix domain-containing protein n=1 Tax=Larkinella soli TaxID=1770527 RepID=UPI000FFB9B63|nr:helix-turn-helix transcriptional regulator [Larkinella soli]
MSQHHHIPQHPLLRASIELFWQVDRSNALFQQETIVPKGVIEVIFNLQESPGFSARLGSRSFALPRCFINGYNSSPLVLTLPEKQLFFGVAFNPAAIRPLFGIPAGEFANQCVEITLVAPVFDSLWHRLGEQPTFQDRVALFSDWAGNRLSGMPLREQRFGSFLSGKVRPVGSVAELADLLCYSPRQLSRKFLSLTGMNTEETLLYRKYLQAVDLIHHSTLSLTETAYACGFVDQSHFIKAFRLFTGLTPGEYRLRKSRVPGHILENVR